MALYWFFAAVDFYLDRRRDDSLIGIHCTHGVNRTGYMIARYLIQRMGYSVSDALECITVARGHPIERENYVSNLGRNLELLPKIKDGKDISRGRTEGEPAQKFAKQPADKGKELDKRHGPARDNYRGRDAWPSPWEPGQGPQSGFPEPKEAGFHRPRRSEFVNEAQFQTAGYLGGGVHHPGLFLAEPRPHLPSTSHFVQEGRRDGREEDGRGLPGFDPRVPPPVFPQQHFEGRRPAHSEFVRDDQTWTAVPSRPYEDSAPPRDIPHHKARLTPPPGWVGPPHPGRYSPQRQRMSPSRRRPMSPQYDERLSPSRRMSPSHSRVSPRRFSPHRGYRMSPSREHRMSPSRGHRMSPPRGHRMSPPRGHRMSPPRSHRMSPPRSQRMSPPRGHRISPPRGHRMSSPHGIRMSPPREHMSPPRRARSPLPPPPRSFRTPPPPTRRSPLHGSGLSPPRRYGSPPSDFRPPSPRGGPMTPPYRRPLLSREPSPVFGGRMTPPDRRASPSGGRHRRSRSLSPTRGKLPLSDRHTHKSRSPYPSRGDMPPPKYSGRRSSPQNRSHPGQDARHGTPDHLDMKYGPEIEPFPLERSPTRSLPRDSAVQSSNSVETRSRSPTQRQDSRRRPTVPSENASSSPSRRRSPLKRARQPLDTVSGREKGRKSPLPSTAKSSRSDLRGDDVPPRGRLRKSPPLNDRRLEHEYDDIHGDTDLGNLRSLSRSPPRLPEDEYALDDDIDVRLPRSESPADPKYTSAKTQNYERETRRRGLLRTPEPVETRRRRTPEPEKGTRRGLLRTPEKPRLRTPDSMRDSGRGLLRTPEPKPRPRPRNNEPRRRSPESLPKEPRRRNSLPEPRETSVSRGRRTPELLEESRRRRVRSPDVGRHGHRSVDREESGRRPRSPIQREESIGRRVRSPDHELEDSPVPQDFVDEDYIDPEPEIEPEPFDDPRRHGVLRTPEPLEVESRRGRPGRDYREDHPRYNRGGHFQRGRRPYNNYRGQGRGRGRISRGGPMRRDSYQDRTIRKPYLDDPQYLDEPSEEYHDYNEFRHSRSRSPIVIPRDEFLDDEPDCRELLIEKRTTEEMGALSPTALDLIGPDDEILFIGSDRGNSHRRPAASRLSPRLHRLSRSPPHKKPVFERLDNKKVPVFERLDDPLLEPRPLLEARPRLGSGGSGQYRGRGQYSQRHSTGPRRPNSTGQSSNQQIRSSQESRDRGIPPTRGISRGASSSRGRPSSSRAGASSSRGRPLTRGASSSGVRAKKPELSETRTVPKKPPGSVGDTTSVKAVRPSVRGRTAAKVSTKTESKLGKSPIKKTPGVSRGRRI